MAIVPALRIAPAAILAVFRLTVEFVIVSVDEIAVNVPNIVDATTGYRKVVINDGMGDRDRASVINAAAIDQSGVTADSGILDGDRVTESVVDATA